MAEQRSELTWRFPVAVGLLALAALASWLVGTPGKLPGAALGWGLLFHVERAVALLGGLGAAGVIGARAMVGEFPFKFGALEYRDPSAKAAAAADAAAAAIIELRDDVAELRELQGLPPGRGVS